jgi:signal transduction histidine kinase
VTLRTLCHVMNSTTVQARSERSSTSRLGQMLEPVISARTWLATMHLLAGLPIGIVLVTLVATGVSLGVGLLPLFLVGIPVLIVTFWIASAGARFERGRYALLLGVTITPPAAVADDSWWPRLLRRLRTASTWRQLAYCVLWLPIGAIDFTLAVALWSVALSLIALPVYNPFLPQGGASIGSFVLDSWWLVACACVAGVAILLVTPHLIRALAAVEATIAGALLGAGRPSPLVARVSELERTRARAMDAAATERVRMERDLHDGAQQRLVSLAMELGRAQAKFDTDPAGARELIDRAHAEAKEALVELRDLVRGVHPPVLSDRGLDAAISGLAALSPIPVTVTVDVAQRPSMTIESIAYFVVAESLANIAKHAHAQRASVEVNRAGDTLRVLVRDDGIGGANPQGQGLTGLADRVSGVDGRLTITSPAGGPTTVDVELPCAS